MFVILLILIFIRPFISSLAFPYINSIYSLLLLVFLTLSIALKGFSANRLKPLKFPLLCFSLALIISTIFSQNKILSSKELYKYVSGLFLFFTVIYLDDENKTKIIRTIVISGLFISLLAIYQYFVGFKHLSDYTAKHLIADPFVLDYAGRKRVFFPFVTPNTLAGYLAMIIPLTFTYKDRILLIIPLSFALLLTKSLGALSSLFLALVVYSFLRGELGKRGIISFIVLIIIISLVFIARTIVPEEHLQPIFSTVMRINYWRDALRTIQHYPLVGVGVGNFNLIQSRYAHNSYLQIWAEVGILGIISLLWLIIAVFKSALNKCKKSPHKGLITGLITANAVFLIHNLVDFSFFLPEVSLIWWVMLGLSYVLTYN